MQIANVKSNADLVGKKKLQGDLLELAVANEAEQERRVKDYKNPNKPVPVAPEYKSNAELQKDRLAQERQAIANMEDFGFDYTKSAELVSWLSSSLINRLVEFNANFRGIKKELGEKTNPKLLNVDYLKNYLENYFEDMDVNFGRKFGKRETDGMTMPTTIDDLEKLMPDASLIDNLIDAITFKYSQVRETIPDFKARIIAIARELTDVSEQEKVAIGETKKGLRGRMNEYAGYLKANEERLKKIVVVLKGLTDVREFLHLYSVVIPSQELLTVMKQSLTQQERAELVRRYVALLRKIKILSRDEIGELIADIQSSIQGSELELDSVSNFIRKLNKGLSFLTDKSIEDINKLQRDYQFVIENSSRTADAGKIKQLTEMREQEIIEAVKALERQKGIYDEVVEEVRDINGNFDFRDPQNYDQRNARQRAKEDVEADAKRERLAQIDAGLMDELRSDREQARIRAEVAKVNLREVPKIEDRPFNEKVQREIDEFVQGYRQYHQKTIKELYDIFNDDNRVGIRTMKNYLKGEFGMTDGQLQKKGRSDNEYMDFMRGKLQGIMEQKIENKINQAKSEFGSSKNEGRFVADYDYIGNSTKAKIGATEQRTQYGVGVKGLPAKVIKHLREDDVENKALSKAFKKHMKIEEEVNGGALKFKHKKIKVGKGISVEAQPAYKTFGKYIIHMGHLLDKNVANFKYPSTGSIPAIKPLTITDDYKDFILDTLENGKPNERFFSKLPDEEQKHFERVISGAGLLEVFKLRRNKSDTEKKESERFNILRGEVMAGNNADKVIKELRGLILRFMNDGRIQQKEGTAMLLELSAI